MKEKSEKKLEMKKKLHNILIRIENFHHYNWKITLFYFLMFLICVTLPSIKTGHFSKCTDKDCICNPICKKTELCVPVYDDNLGPSPYTGPNKCVKQTYLSKWFYMLALIFLFLFLFCLAF